MSWSLHNKSKTDLSALLQSVDRSRKERVGGAGGQHQQVVEGDSVPVTLVQLLESTLWSRRLGVATEDIISALVGSIFEGIREHVITCVELKFNAFFLMPMMDEFPTHLREVLETAYADDVDGIFNVSNIRGHLEARQRSLDQELSSVEALQAKFAGIHNTLVQPAGAPKAAEKFGKAGTPKVFSGGFGADARRPLREV